MDESNRKAYAVIVAGGVGRRMGRNVPKQYLLLAGRPILARTLEVFEKTAAIDGVIVVVPRGHVANTRADIVKKFGFGKVRAVCQGGERRQDSVLCGLRAIKEPCDVVAIHDGVRPFVTADQISRSVHVARHFGAALVAAPVSSTIKMIADDGFVVSTPERRKLMAAQTPQTFRYDVILRAFEEAVRDDFRATDDSQLAERMGVMVVIVQGDPDNIKITSPVDLELAEVIWRRRRATSNGKKK